MKLPVADTRTVARMGLTFLGGHRGQLTAVVVVQSLAALAALAMPWLLGSLVDSVTVGTTMAEVNRIGLYLVVAVVCQTLLSAWAHRASLALGEELFAELREDFLREVTHLPLSTVERAGTGDLLGRTTNDIDRVQWVLRFGIPALLVGITTVVLTYGAAFLVDWRVAIALLVGLPLLWWSTRRYLKVAMPAYLETSASYAEINGVVTENVSQAGTIDALGIGRQRREAFDRTAASAWNWELVTALMRVRLFRGLEISFVLPLGVVIVWGAFLIDSSSVTIGAVTAIALYAMQVRAPFTELLFWVDELQVAVASLARIFGIGLVEPDRQVSGERPTSGHIRARGVRYAYVEGKDVLHGIDLDLRPGERLAIVGPSGAGKSTFGRMLAGIHPPTGGTVTVGDVPLVDLTEDDLRREVALVTQEHHVFVGSLADNLRLADPDASEATMREALDAVDALDWVDRLPGGLDTEVGSGSRELTPAQAQQLALARLVLLDPHTLVLDEATSLLDPRAARHLERSLDRVLSGRTVVAIAHRLHTAHDADRVAVVDGGRIVELGSHDELVAAGGEYASLWASWHQE
ncbi:Putative ABC iron siderophore transporter, fused permease and ATPase domains [Actinomycetales bacterium JB111]|nr:Putative ABC iron siderophore transporter, fused permease and ATPase domains [Actinomycetales bacterium JB111]